MSKSKCRVACFASGEGTNFTNLYEKSKDLNYEIALLISNNSGSGVMQRAIKHGVPAHHISKVKYDDPDKKVLELLNEYDIDIIALCGYMKKISDDIVKKYENRILNVHPALLPKYGGQGMYGSNVHKAVHENKEKESGATIHLVNEEYDKGRILLQKSVAISENDGPDEISAKVRDIEFELYPIALNDHCASLNE